jgi:hypothetical protein
MAVSSKKTLKWAKLEKETEIFGRFARATSNEMFDPLICGHVIVQSHMSPETAI